MGVPWILLQDNTDNNYMQMSDVIDTNKLPYWFSDMRNTLPFVDNFKYLLSR